MHEKPSPPFVDRWLPWATIAVFIAWFFDALWRHPSLAFWDVPEGSDAIFQGTMIKSMIETGWVFDSPRLGAPFGMNMMDFPGADGALLLVIKLLTFFSSDPTVVMNLFYVTGFLLVFAASFWVLRRLRFDSLWSTAVALVFTCLPYHFLRGVNHLYLSAYFVVPLLTWAALKIYPGEAGDAEVPGRWTWKEVAVLVVGGAGGVYYAFFGMILLLLTGLLGTVAERKAAYVKRAVLAIVVVAASVLANMAPNLAYLAREGANPQVAQRAPLESEVYGLRMAQLLLPIWGHRNAAMARFGRTYHDALRPITEASSSALGVVGGCGFVLLFGYMFFARPEADRRVVAFAKMNLALFVYAAVGGFAVLFALLVTPQFRGANRASIYIGFISLAGLFMWLRTRPWPRLKRIAGESPWRYPLALLLVFWAFYDQVPVGARPALPPPGTEASGPAAFKQFIARVEAEVPQGGMIYVLPYVSFPESPPAFHEGYNGMMRPYYYSSHARWSYGAMRGRAGDAWLQAVEALPLPERIEAIRKSGFRGIYVQRNAYADHGAATEAQLRKVLGAPALESGDGNEAFYRVPPVAQVEVTPALTIAPGENFYTWEKDGARRWAWARADADLLLLDFDDKPAAVHFSAELSSLNPRTVWITIRGQEVFRAHLQPGTAARVDLDLTLPHGTTDLALHSDAPEVLLPTDSRALGIMVAQPELKKR